MKVLIKGAGDLASGIAVRLHRSGFFIVMTEIEVPTTVRRNVAFSPAVYQEEAAVEEVSGKRCQGISEIDRVLDRDQIAVIVDRECRIREEWKPDIIVDAILAKQNLGTRITDAPFVIGVGPGFSAGEDCHCAVETKRGHDLGRCIWKGGAEPNTGVPGVIGGFAMERLIKATGSGIFRGKVSIGDLVKQGDLVGYSGEKPVYALVDGVVRGLLQDGVEVKTGMKSGDIDPRGIVPNCFTVSDKSLAVAGGVLEGVLSFLKNRER